MGVSFRSAGVMVRCGCLITTPPHATTTMAHPRGQDHHDATSWWLGWLPRVGEDGAGGRGLSRSGLPCPLRQVRSSIHSHTHFLNRRPTPHTWTISVPTDD